MTENVLVTAWSMLFDLERTPVVLPPYLLPFEQLGLSFMIALCGRKAYGSMEVYRCALTTPLLIAQWVPDVQYCCQHVRDVFYRSVVNHECYHQACATGRMAMIT